VAGTSGRAKKEKIVVERIEVDDEEEEEEEEDISDDD
jgi:hypothetical protein